MTTTAQLTTGRPDVRDQAFYNAVFRAGTPRRGPGQALRGLGAPGGPGQGELDAPTPFCAPRGGAAAYGRSYSGPPFLRTYVLRWARG